MSLSTALSIFLPALAGVAGGGGGTPAKKGDSGGGFLSDAASAFLKIGSDEAPFQYADAPIRNRTVQELTRGNIYGRQPTQSSVPGGPVRFDYANNTQLARVMRNLQDNATNSQVKELMYAYANPVEPEDTSTGAGQVKMTEVNVR